ncbi:MAG TPA: hemolysin family protein [Pyrinomonadaceae bacterium]|nr:hemolysin family protein [Pyrinomonadaceae bacterium]
MTALKLISILVIVAANGFFVAAEFAFVGVRRSRIEALASEGNARARRLLRILGNLNAYLSASQLGITLASLALAILGEPTIAALIEEPLGRLLVSTGLFGESAVAHGAEGGTFNVVKHSVAFVIAYSLLTSLHITLGEQAPKLFGLERAERVAMFSALPMEVFYKVFRPFIHALDWASAAMVRPFGLHATGEHASAYTEAELRQVIEMSRRGGHIQEEEQKLINRVFDFADAEVREAMIPRTEVQALPVTATLADVESAFCEYGFSRMPVYSERLDDIAGILFMKDLMPCLRTVSPQEFSMERMLHPPLFVPASAKLGSVLRQMQAGKTHIACVVDEHGGLEGIVTLEDLLEEIVGEINDEYDEESRSQIVEEPGGTYLLDGMLAVRDANRHFDLKLPEEAGYTTMAGFLLAQAGRILTPGETVAHDGASFLVEQVEGRRIRRIRYTPAPAAPDGEPEEQEAARDA